MNINVMRLSPSVDMPVAREGDAGIDLRASQRDFIPPGQRRVVPLGVVMEIPSGHYGLVTSRSGLMKKFGIICCPGVIDSSYRGEVCAQLLNTGNTDFHINPGDRVCQLVVMATPEVTLLEAGWLTDTSRGAGGFGSTGTN